MPEIEVPVPMVGLAVTPKTRADETKMRPALDRIEREDLTFKTVRNEETHELIIKGMSMLHLETMLLRMKERTKVEVERKTPKVAYRETVRGSADTRSRACCSNCSFTGQAGVVSSMLKRTWSPSITTSFTKPSSTMLLPKSGSTIGRSASSTSLTLGGDMALLCR